MNADQRNILDNVKSHLLHQKQHEEGKCKCNIKSLRQFVSGVGGTRKSFLIEAINAFVDDLWLSDIRGFEMSNHCNNGLGRIQCRWSYYSLVVSATDRT